MTTSPQHSDEWLDEALAQRDYEINNVPKHWEDTDEKKAADQKFRTVILAELNKREAAASHEAKSDKVDITVIRHRWSKLKAGLIAVDPLLKQPYPDDERWTPWTRFIGPRASELERAINPDRQVTLRSEAEQ